MWWLRTARLLARPGLPPLSSSLVSFPTLRPFFNPATRMSSFKRYQNTLDTRPPINREMAQQSLDRSAFKKRITVLAASVPAEKASFFLKSQELKGSVASVRLPSRRLTTGTCRSIINIPKTKSIVQDPSNPQKRLVLFRVPEFGQFLFHSGVG